MIAGSLFFYEGGCNLKKFLIVLIVFAFGFLCGLFAGNIIGWDTGRQQTLGEVYNKHNVNKVPMSNVVEIAGAGSEGKYKVWEKE